MYSEYKNAICKTNCGMKVDGLIEKWRNIKQSTWNWIDMVNFMRQIISVGEQLVSVNSLRTDRYKQYNVQQASHWMDWIHLWNEEKWITIYFQTIYWDGPDKNTEGFAYERRSGLIQQYQLVLIHSLALFNKYAEGTLHIAIGNSQWFESRLPKLITVYITLNLSRLASGGQRQGQDVDFRNRYINEGYWESKY